jgi:hypothetical protein
VSCSQGMNALNMGANSTEAKAKGDEAFKGGLYDVRTPPPLARRDNFAAWPEKIFTLHPWLH